LGKRGVYVNGNFEVKVHVYLRSFFAGGVMAHDDADERIEREGFGSAHPNEEILDGAAVDSDVKSVLMYNLFRAVVAELADALA
jgi:hypothetical protein